MFLPEKKDCIVAIGMSAYNSEATIGIAVSSILSQDNSNWHLTIIDAHSDDQTWQMCKGYAQMDERISIIRMPNRSNWYENAKLHLEWNSSPFFMWADADDAWSSNWISENLKALGSGNFAVSFGRLYTMNAASELSFHPSFGKIFQKFSQRSSIMRTLGFFAEPEGFGKANLIYGIWRSEYLNKYFPRGYSDFSGAKDLAFLGQVIQFHRIACAPKAAIIRRVPNLPSGWKLDEVEFEKLGDHKEFKRPLPVLKAFFGSLPVRLIPIQTEKIEKRTVRYLSVGILLGRSGISEIATIGDFIWSRVKL
jgi:hypothetical protein